MDSLLIRYFHLWICWKSLLTSSAQWVSSQESPIHGGVNNQLPVRSLRMKTPSSENYCGHVVRSRHSGIRMAGVVSKQLDV